jgi:hypothetical protein
MPSSRMPDRLVTATEALTEAEQVTLLKSLVKVIRSLQEQGELPCDATGVEKRYR